MLFPPAPRYVRSGQRPRSQLHMMTFCRSNDVVTGSNLTYILVECIRVCVSVIFCDWRCSDESTKVCKQDSETRSGKAAAVLDLQRQTERKPSSHNTVIYICSAIWYKARAGRFSWSRQHTLLSQIETLGIHTYIHTYIHRRVGILILATPR